MLTFLFQPGLKKIMAISWIFQPVFQFQKPGQDFQPGTKILYTLFQNGRHFSFLFFPYKLALLTSLSKLTFKEYLNSNEAKRANLQSNKRILKWQPFWNKVYRHFHFKSAETNFPWDACGSHIVVTKCAFYFDIYLDIYLTFTCPLALRWRIGPPHELSIDSCLALQCAPLSRTAALLCTSPFLLCAARLFLAGLCFSFPLGSMSGL